MQKVCKFFEFAWPIFFYFITAIYLRFSYSDYLCIVIKYYPNYVIYSTMWHKLHNFKSPYLYIRKRINGGCVFTEGAQMFIYSIQVSPVFADN
jgi:hypothetical protein